MGSHRVRQTEQLSLSLLSQAVLEVKDSHANTGDIRDWGSIPGLGRPPGEGHSNSLQNSCLENTVNRRPFPWNFKELDRKAA